MEYRGVTNQEQSMFFHGQAIQGLAALIDQKAKTAENRNELLAAIMLLVYYEVVCERIGILPSVLADLLCSWFKGDGPIWLMATLRAP
jgi:hypothetical protein